MSLDEEMDYERLAQHYANGESDDEPPDLSGSIDILAESIFKERQVQAVANDPCLPAFVQSFVGPALLSREWTKEEVFDLFSEFKALLAGTK
jgi:hypothetical protein